MTRKTKSHITSNSILVFSIFALMFSACGQTRSDHAKQKSSFKTFELDFDFKVTVGEEKNFGTFTTYTYFRLDKDNSTIYLDTLSNEYEFGNNLFPIVMQTGENSFELLFEINDRPSKNYLKRLFFSNNKLVEQDKLPIFEAKAQDINGDGIEEYAGYWDYAQAWGENNSLTAYNPILYYSVTKTGLKLDSVMTRKRNEVIYVEFYGFSFSEKDVQPISIVEKFERELKSIRNEQ